MSSVISNGPRTVILVNGIPAAGKSTVTRRLSSELHAPFLTIDGIKEPFMAHFDQIDRRFNRLLGCAAYEAIWSIVAQSPASCLWLIDAWFGFQPRATLEHHLQQAGVERVLEIWNQISPELAVARYRQRLHQRKPGHPGEEYLPELAALAKKAAPMALGPVFTLEQPAAPEEIASLDRWVTEHLQPARRRAAS